MATLRVQTGDKVKVIAGKFKGNVGQVTKIVKKDKRGKKTIRAAVSGLPGMVKYQRSARFANMPGGMYNVDRLVDISNLSLVDDKGNNSKVKFEIKDGKKVRVLKKTGEQVVKQEILKEGEEKESEKKTKKASAKKKEDTKKTK